MKIKFVSFTLIAVAVILVAGMAFKIMQPSSKLSKPAVANEFALVELFTSEGCSVARLQKKLLQGWKQKIRQVF